MSHLPHVPHDGPHIGAVACGPSQPNRRRRAAKRKGSSADAEAYASASSLTVAPDVPTTVLKRPAACPMLQAPVQYEAEPAIPPPPPAWSQPAPASLPKWAPHAVNVLMHRGHLSNKTGQQKQLELTVWSDCSGINSEMFALRELGNELRVGLDVLL